MSRKKRHQNETVNETAEEIIETEMEESEEMNEKKSLGTKIGETFVKVKNAKATKVVVATLGAAAIAAGAYFAGKKGLPDFGSNDLDDFVDDDETTEVNDSAVEESTGTEEN